MIISIADSGKKMAFCYLFPDWFLTYSSLMMPVKCETHHMRRLSFPTYMAPALHHCLLEIKIVRWFGLMSGARDDPRVFTVSGLF